MLLACALSIAAAEFGHNCCIGTLFVSGGSQVVGDTQAAFDITQYDTLVFGANGLLLAGPNSRTYEPLLASYLQLISMDLFVRNLFTRILVILDDFKEVWCGTSLPPSLPPFLPLCLPASLAHPYMWYV